MQSFGQVDVTWSPPVVKIRSAAAPFAVTDATLLAAATEYEVGVAPAAVGSADGGGGGAASSEAVVRVAGTKYSVSGPVWGQEYNVRVTCVLQTQPVPCGATKGVAAVVARDQRANGLILAMPRNISAHAIADNAVLIKWVNVDLGWVPKKYSISVSETSFNTEVARGDLKVKLSDLNTAKTYSVTFKPVLDGFPDPPANVQNLYFTAFLGSVGLAATVLWSGSVRLTWNPAQACVADFTTELTSFPLPAVAYQATLTGNGTNRTLDLNADALSAEFPGIRVNVSYTGTLKCSFLRPLKELTPSAPTGTQVKPGSKNVTIYDLKRVGASWRDAEAICMRLFPVDHSDLCVLFLRTSVWSDESPYTYFPISSKKGPSKSDCCLKVVRLANNRFDWQADQCNFLKSFLCETRVNKLTSDMVNMSLANTTANATVFSWNTSGTNWEGRA
ncbi:unnamed protein product [Notodromas monacha]|uniref:C-type lectin domain-containing protein n=1 Tax=Notodromas monacha TaxID=399045 RepID=A0A7R9BWQ5_9CRUS|nr:unnamed protein product [Notodromas monacha]CAG0922221.1 unnamed protein product [Notodromas monacha]